MLNRIKQTFKRAAIRGGVHPDSRKNSSANLPIAKVPIPKYLYLPLRQHAGAEAIAIVKVGEYVYKGQVIAQAGSEVSAPVHASSSGIVVGIGEIPVAHPSGLMAKGIVIECDGKDQWLLAKHLDVEHTSAMELANAVAKAGVVGMGGAIFPAAVKLKQGLRHEIKTLLVNGSECEPYLTTDDRLMQERATEIVSGAILILKILNAYRIVFAIEDNKPAAIAAIKAASQTYGVIEVEVVPALYPMGSAKQLIHAITGREVPAEGRSTEVGVLVHNVGTVYAIQQALCSGRPLISRVVTVAGNCIEQPRNVEVLIGTPVQDVIAYCGGLKKDPAKLILGGPMMGQVFVDTQVPVIKGVTGILALDHNEIPQSQVSACIRCARCVDACPMGLMPFEMAANAKVDKFEGAQDYGLNDCILCGSCAYVCPSHIPLVQYFQYAMGELDQRKQAAKRNEQIKQLMQARSSRIEAEQAARQAAKQKRQKSSAVQPSSEGTA